MTHPGPSAAGLFGPTLLGFAMGSLSQTFQPVTLGFTGGALRYATSDEMTPRPQPHGSQKQATYALTLGIITRPLPDWRVC